ncbi:MAG: hypothetical protein A2Y40_00170 [Candidatus Margulisbacteria bacterium GWF2_35_9]|nr:MAG: hypothetical protein A2Y40_00170 [Candidatus Margulisbacteria bacterium GWF2_35_9]
MIKKIVIVLLVVFSSLVFAKDEVIPNFQLNNLLNTKVSLYEFTQEKQLTFLCFFATWCSYCEKDIVGFEELNKKYQNKKIGFVAISFDKKISTVETYVKVKKLTYPVVMGNSKIAEYFSIRGIPVTVVLNENNEIIDKVVGYMESAYFEAIINKKLGESKKHDEIK